MPRPILDFVRHGETDWNREKRLQGQHDIPLNALGRTQAQRCGVLLRDLLTRNGSAMTDFDYVSSPIGPAREHLGLMFVSMALGAGSWRTDARLMDVSFGRWEGFPFAELQSREAEALAARERDKWGFVLPGGESYAQLEARVQVWYEGLERETVASAHGGVCRSLMALLGVVQPEEASMGTIGQGVVYVFDGHAMTRHE